MLSQLKYIEEEYGVKPMPITTWQCEQCGCDIHSIEKVRICNTCHGYSLAEQDAKEGKCQHCGKFAPSGQTYCLTCEAHGLPQQCEETINAIVATAEKKLMAKKKDEPAKPAEPVFEPEKVPEATTAWKAQDGTLHPTPEAARAFDAATHLVRFCGVMYQENPNSEADGLHPAELAELIQKYSHEIFLITGMLIAAEDQGVTLNRLIQIIKQGK